MAIRTGSTYISKCMRGIIKIQTANLRFSTTKRLSLGDSNNGRQPEMAAETGNTYIFETATDSVEVPTANSGFSTTTNSIKVQPSDCDNDGQPRIIPVTPRRPVAPVGPIMPCGPVSPGGPVIPVAPRGPASPVNPTIINNDTHTSSRNHNLKPFEVFSFQQIKSSLIV